MRLKKVCYAKSAMQTVENPNSRAKEAILIIYK